jgi:RNA polymerase sigma-70 factor (ECF subfamily)
MSETDELFEEHRPALARLAYRMLGSLADAEDVLQDAYLRWARDGRQAVQSPRAYLLTIVTRLCIDQRQSIEARKMTYVGPWLPEPVVEPVGLGPGAPLETAESVSMALLLVLESLSPVERAAYLLRRIFDYDYDTIARILDKSEPSCRQLVSRAEQRIHERRPRFDPDPVQAERLTDAFLEACSTGDLNGLVQILASDAIMYSDGGGKAAAALAPIRGAEKIARFFIGIMKKVPSRMEVRRVRVNGQPGLVITVDGQLIQVLTLDVADGRIANCFVVRNPDKLARVGKTWEDESPCEPTTNGGSDGASPSR